MKKVYMNRLSVILSMLSVMLILICLFTPLNICFCAQKQDYILKEVFRTKWGSENGQLGLTTQGPIYGFPEDFCVDNEGNIVFVDSANHRISKYDSNGKLVASFGSEYPEKGMYSAAYEGINADGDNNLYALNRAAGQIIKYDNTGKYIDKISDPDWRIGVIMSVTRNGDIYVGRQTFKKYSKKEKQKVLGIFGASGEEYVAEDSNYAYESPGGNVYELEKQNREIRFKRTKKISTGTGIMSAADKTPKDMSFSCDLKKGDRFIGFDNTDNYYVTDYRYKHIRKYDPDGNLIVQLDLPKNPGIASYRFRIVKVDGKGNIYCFLYDDKEAWIVKMGNMNI